MLAKIDKNFENCKNRSDGGKWLTRCVIDAKIHVTRQFLQKGECATCVNQENTSLYSLA